MAWRSHQRVVASVQSLARRRSPMSRQAGVDFVRLLDDNGREVRNAFLPLEADFWNPAHTRYTLFLDPGRVKRGILPNEQMGRALRSGAASRSPTPSARVRP